MTDTAATPAVQQDGRPGVDQLEAELEQHRSELIAHAYRMLGSPFEAEDAVQDAFVRAWRSYEGFEARAAVKSWLYRITTNVCLDMLNGRQRRAMPMDLGPAQGADTPLPAPLPEVTWIHPVPDERVVPEAGDPALIAEARDTIRLAFISALQRLAPRQRAVLLLREVLRWKAEEVAELLETSVASVNSALQRARATIETTDAHHETAELDEEHQALLARYVDAFERYDMDSLTSLLREDATWSMPPFDLWLQTHEDIVMWCLGPGIGCEGSRLIPTVANGAPAFAQYKPAEDGTLRPWSLQVLTMEKGQITGICFFLDTDKLFPLFGMPEYLER